MFRHVVQMSWNRDLTDKELARVHQVLDNLGARSPDIRGFSHGPDAGIREGGASYALIADFEDADGWRAYSAHPAHDEVREVLRDLVRDQSVVQFWTLDGPQR
jgi:hypothetical protein